MCRHIYDWNIVNCDVKQPIQLNSSDVTGLTLHAQKYIQKNATLV